MFKLKIVTPDTIIYEGEINQLNVKTSNGAHGILTNHIPMVEIIVPSILTFKDDKEELHEMTTSGGWLIVKEEETTIVTAASEDIKVLEKDRILDKLQTANETYNDDLDEVSKWVAKSRINKENNRLNAMENQK